MRLTGQLSLPAWLMHYFLIDFCSGAPLVRKFGNLCIQEILVLRKSFVRVTASVRTSTPSCKPGCGKLHSFRAF